MAKEEHITAALTDGTTEEVWAILDPDRHPWIYMTRAVRELIVRKRGSLPLNVQVTRLSFDPAY